jgi:hypothetical protein
MCWVFETVPSKLNRILWSHSRRDVVVATKLKVGHEQALITQTYTSLVSVVSQALGAKPTGGSGGGGGGGEAPEGVMVPKNEDEMRQAFKSVFGYSG